MNISRNMRNLGGRLTGLLILTVIVVAANAIIGGLNRRVDLTDENLFSLSTGTRNILKALDRPVVLKFFFNSSNPEVPMPLKEYARRVEDLLVEYEYAAGGKLAIEKYDPKPDSDAEDWAKRYGLSGQSLGFMGPAVYIGLVAVMGDAEAALPALDPRSENLLEYNITRVITRVANPEKPVVGVLGSLPVMGMERPPYPMPGQPEPAPKWFAFTDLGEDYDVRKLDASAEDIPADIDALVLVHPKDLSDKTLFAIDQFVLRGGKLVAFLDPQCVAEAEAQPMAQMQFSAKSSNLDKLLKAWGVTFDTGKVVADLEASSRLRTADNQVEESPVWLSLRRPNLNADDILTSQLESIMMPFAGAFTVEPAKDVTVTPLITTSTSSGQVDGMMAQFSTDSVRREFKSGFTALNLAVRLQGKLKTAFPDGKPAASDSSEDKSKPEGDEAKAEAAPAPPSMTESVDKSNVVLVGDADMLYDRFCVREANFFGFEAHEPLNDNLSFFLNAVEQMAGSTDLVGIRTRGRTDRPFDVVIGLQRQAQERYMTEERSLQEKLDETQRRLGELQSEKDPKNQQFILSPEQKQEVDRFQKQLFDTRTQLKLVRRKLREDIEWLGVKVKVINILLMPALVSAAGIGFWFHRRRLTQR